MKNSKFKIHNSKYKIQNLSFKIQIQNLKFKILNSKIQSSKFKIQNIQSSKLKTFNIQNSKLKMFKIQSLFFPNSLQAWGSNLFTRAWVHCVGRFWPSARRQYELHRQNIIFQFSLHFLTGTELHRNSEVHGGTEVV